MKHNNIHIRGVLEREERKRNRKKKKPLAQFIEKQ